MSCHSMVNSSTKSKGQLWAHQWQLTMPIYLSEFEQGLLHDYQQRYKHKPALWLRFIDDIFLVWIGNDASFIAFFKYCNNYTVRLKMLSNIKLLVSRILCQLSAF